MFMNASKNNNNEIVDLYSITVHLRTNLDRNRNRNNLFCSKL